MIRIVAFDADVLICAAYLDHPLGVRVKAALADPSLRAVGSVLLLTEVLAKPIRQSPDSEESRTLKTLLGEVDLKDVDLATSRLALSYAIEFRLRVADATHLATAVAAGADAFLTNNRKDFPKTIEEIEVLYPDDLPA